ncbi:MAG: hypothetical protein HRU09_08840 [Oligoflexales bacterium]|nr:hypothetical protein [Oligoflexales bacterium]
MKVIPYSLFNYSKSEHYRSSLKQFLTWAESSQLQPPHHFHPTNLPDSLLEQLAFQALFICDPDQGEFEREETDFITFLALAAYSMSKPERPLDLKKICKIKRLKIFLGYARVVLGEYYARMDGSTSHEFLGFADMFNVPLDPSLEALLKNS